MSERQEEADRRNIELLIAEGALTTWWVVRSGELQQVPMDPAHMTQVEAAHASEVMETYNNRLERRIHTFAKFMELLEPYMVDGNPTMDEACKRIGLTLAEAWALAQAEGPTQ